MGDRAAAVKALQPSGPDAPTYGVIQQDQFGNPVHGWIDRNARTTTPATAPGPTFKEARELRTEIRQLPSFKNMAEVVPRFNAMVTAADNRAGDLTLTYGLMKVLDPQSVVRESEVGMAQQIATIPENFRAQVQSFLTGKGRLDPTVRAAMLQEAQRAAVQHRAAYDRDTGMYRGIAGRSRMNIEDVIPSFEPFASMPAAAPTPQQQLEAEARRRGLIP
jgi:hypothetical protein